MRKLIGGVLAGLLLGGWLTVASIEAQPGPYSAMIQSALRAFLTQAHTWTALQTFTGGIGIPSSVVDTLTFDIANQDVVLSRGAAGRLDLTDGTPGVYRDLRLRDVTASRAIQTTMAQPSTLAATPSQLGTDLAAGVYTITVTALDLGGGQTDDPTAITCTIAAGGAGRCAVTWAAVPGAVSYRVWTSLVDAAVPTRYFAASTNAYNLNTLTGATVATLPTANSAYVVFLSPSATSWFGGGPVMYRDGSVSAPSIAFASEPDVGFYRPGSDRIALAINGTQIFAIQPGSYNFDFNGGLYAGSGGEIGWVSGGTYDTRWARGAQGIMSGASFDTTIQIGDPGARPACSSAYRGLFWHDRGVTGGGATKDDVQLCAKDTADVYAWRGIYGGPIYWDSSTSATAGVLYKDGTRFFHDFHHPTGGGAIPLGRNLFIGRNAGNFTMGSTATLNYEASYNIGIGENALSQLTLGHENTVIGNDALSQVGDTASWNVAVGAATLNALFSGGHNTAIGYESLPGISTTSYNTALGDSAGRFQYSAGGNFNTGSAESTYLGALTSTSGPTPSNETVIGSYARGAGDNTMVLGSDDVLRWYFGAPGTSAWKATTQGTMYVAKTTTTVTCNSGTGTCTATTLIPAGAKVHSVTARVTTILAGAGLTTWSLGFAGQTAIWATGKALAAGTIVNSTDHAANWSTGGLDFFAAATSVLLTAAAGQFDSGVVKITVLYEASLAPGG